MEVRLAVGRGQSKGPSLMWDEKYLMQYPRLFSPPFSHVSSPAPSQTRASLFHLFAAAWPPCGVADHALGFRLRDEGLYLMLPQPSAAQPRSKLGGRG